MTAQGQPSSRAAEFGETLRRLREASGVTLDSICSETKISRRILEALESGRFQFLPEAVFTRNFVRQYARIIGAGENDLLEQFDAAWDRFVASSGSHPSLVTDDEPPRQPIRWGIWFPLLLGLAVLIAAGVVIIRGSRPAEQGAPDPLRTLAGLPTPASSPTGVPSPTAATTTAPTPGDQADGADGKLDLGLRVTMGKECWVRYRDGEGHTEQRLLQAGEELGLELQPPVLLTLGNAAAVTVRVASTEYRDLGRPGEVLHVEVTQSGVRPLRAGTGNEQ